MSMTLYDPFFPVICSKKCEQFSKQEQTCRPKSPSVITWRSEFMYHSHNRSYTTIQQEAERMTVSGALQATVCWLLRFWEGLAVRFTGAVFHSSIRELHKPDGAQPLVSLKPFTFHRKSQAPFPHTHLLLYSIHTTNLAGQTFCCDKLNWIIAGVFLQVPVCLSARADVLSAPCWTNSRAEVTVCGHRLSNDLAW